MAIMTRDTNPQLFTPIYDKFAFEEFELGRKVLQPLFETVGITGQKDYKVDRLSNLGQWADMSEGAEIPGQSFEQLYPKTYTVTKKGVRISATFEDIDDDRYYLQKQIGVAKNFGKLANQTVEQSLANIFNNYTSTAAAYLGSDGVALVSASHPQSPSVTGTLYSNLITTALSHDAVEEMEIKIATNGKNAKGEIIEILPDTLLVNPTLLGTALRICNERAQDRPGTGNRDINVYAGKYKVVCSPFLTSTTTWGLIASGVGLKLVWRKKPGFTMWTDYNKEIYYWAGTMRYIAGDDTWYGVWMSSGTT